MNSQLPNFLSSRKQEDLVNLEAPTDGPKSAQDYGQAADPFVNLLLQNRFLVKRHVIASSWCHHYEAVDLQREKHDGKVLVKISR